MNENYFEKIEKLKLMSDFNGFPYKKKNENINSNNKKTAKIIKKIQWKLTTYFNKYSGTQMNRTFYEWKKDLYFTNKIKPSIAVYTCVTNNYDIPKEPLFSAPNIDYYIFTDSVLDLESVNWKVININTLINDDFSNLDNIQKNRFIKMHPHIFFKKYDNSLYIDGNVTVISDITPLIKSIGKNVGVSLHSHNNRNCLYDEAKVLKILGKGNKIKINKQVKKYSREGFPKDYGLLEATIILADLKNKTTNTIFNSWWKEFIESESYRDQLSLPYILWKQNISCSEVSSLGENLYRSSKFFVENHK